MTVSVTEALTEAPSAPQSGGRRLTLLPLAAMVIGSMIGAGTFSLPHDMSAHAAPGPVLIGWGITGVGMLALGAGPTGAQTAPPPLPQTPRGGTWQSVR